jgi:hypothetical protein
VAKATTHKALEYFLWFFLCALCALCGECFSRFNTENTEATEGTEKEKRVVTRVSCPEWMRRISSGNFLVRAAKFPASEEAGYSSFDVLRQVTRVLTSAVFSVFSVPSVVNAFQDLTQRTRRAQRGTESAERRSHGSRITSHGFYGPHSSYIPATDRRRHRAVVEIPPRAAPRGPGIFRPPVSPRAVVHAGGHLSGERQPHGSDSALHRARSGKAAGRARARRAAAGDGCGLYARSA